MSRTNIILGIGIVVGFILLTIGIFTFHNHSLVGMLLVGPILLSICVASLASMKIEGKAFDIKYPSSGSWISRGSDGYISAGVISFLFGIIGVAMIVLSLYRRD